MEDKLRRKVLRLLREGKYFATAYAVREMEEDGVFDSDVIAAAETMASLRRQLDEKRAARYVFEGESLGRRLGVVGRITLRGRFKIITVHEIKEE